MTTWDNWILVTIYPVSGSQGFKLNKDHLGAVWSGLASTEVWDTGIVGTMCHPQSCALIRRIIRGDLGQVWCSVT